MKPFSPSLFASFCPVLRDETYIKVKDEDKYLYRAIDSDGQTLDFVLTAKRDAQAAKRFLHKTLQATHTQEPRVINVDKNAAYPKAIAQMKAKGELALNVELRQNKYLNNRIEQDHRFIKRLTKPGMGFHSFNTAQRTLRGFEAMNILRKRQVVGVEKGDILARTVFVFQIFGMAA
jgi:transposase-like protein